MFQHTPFYTTKLFFIKLRNGTNNNNGQKRNLTSDNFLLLNFIDKIVPVKNKNRDFSGGPVVKKPPSSAGDMGSIPGRGAKIPHAVGQLSPCTATTETTCSGAHAPQLERSPRAATKDPACRS